MALHFTSDKELSRVEILRDLASDQLSGFLHTHISEALSSSRTAKSVSKRSRAARSLASRIAVVSSFASITAWSSGGAGAEAEGGR